MNNHNTWNSIFLKKYYSYLILLALTFLFYNCKSSKTHKSDSRSQVQELDEDIFFEEDEEYSDSRREKGGKGERDKVKKVIKSARSYIGTPYRYGGTTRSGMDCSGLLVSCFRTVDISLPRTSIAQSSYGKRVDIDELQEGDLVFFAPERKNRISHVGMVTEVRGRKDIKFIHASSSLGVVEANLFSPYFMKIFVKAVRPF